jgi:outer membrane lipoprotein-sorting protein
MTSLIALAALAMPTAQSYGINDIVQPAFKDATFVAQVIRGNQSELRKINADFAYSYRFKSMKAFVKEPFMMRLEATVEDTSLLYILNGTRKLYRIPKMRLNHTEDVSRAPGKRQTPMDFGIFTPSLFERLMEAKFVRVDRANNNLVFDITYNQNFTDDWSRHRVWIEPTRKYVTKREWYSQENKLMATFLYDKPVNQRGVWFPTRCVVRNVENKEAGITEYQSMSINTGLNDSLFKF